jgi:hypothetical protein
MSKEWIINDANFSKIKDAPFMNEDSIKHFINTVVYKHPNSGILLRNFSDIYVLNALIGSQSYLKDGEKSWKEIMNKEEYDILEKNRTFVIAYMLVEERTEHLHYIVLFDTVIRGNNLGYHIINEYENKREYNVKLIPQEIIKSSVKYWAKILDLLDDQGKPSKDLINEFIEINNIKAEDISWQHLYDLCDE